MIILFMAHQASSEPNSSSKKNLRTSLSEKCSCFVFFCCLTSRALPQQPCLTSPGMKNTERFAKVLCLKPRRPSRPLRWEAIWNVCWAAAGIRNVFWWNTQAARAIYISKLKSPAKQVVLAQNIMERYFFFLCFCISVCHPFVMIKFFKNARGYRNGGNCTIVNERFLIELTLFRTGVFPRRNIWWWKLSLCAGLRKFTNVHLDAILIYYSKCQMWMPPADENVLYNVYFSPVWMEGYTMELGAPVRHIILECFVKQSLVCIYVCMYVIKSLFIFLLSVLNPDCLACVLPMNDAYHQRFQPKYLGLTIILIVTL